MCHWHAIPLHITLIYFRNYQIIIKPPSRWWNLWFREYTWLFSANQLRAARLRRQAPCSTPSEFLCIFTLIYHKTLFWSNNSMLNKPLSQVLEVTWSTTRMVPFWQKLIKERRRIWKLQDTQGSWPLCHTFQAMPSWLSGYVVWVNTTAIRVKKTTGKSKM